MEEDNEMEVKEVYCINCKYVKREGLVHYCKNSIQTIERNSLVTGKMIIETEPRTCRYVRGTNPVCPNYKRKWYKFWI